MQPDHERQMSTPARFLHGYGGLAVILGIAVAFAVAIERTSLFYHVDSWFADAIHELTAPKIRFDEVLIVDVNESSMAALEPQFGAWPYDRDVFALVTAHLNALGARTVVYNVIFSDRRDGDVAFGTVLAESDNVWLAGQAHSRAETGAVYQDQLNGLAWKYAGPPVASERQSFRLPNPTITGVGDPAVGVGMVSVEPDADGILRRMSLLHRAGGSYLPSLPLGALFPPKSRPPISVTEGEISVGDFKWPIDENGNVYLRVPNNLDMFPGISFDRIVFSALGSASSPLDPHIVKDRTVIIGSSAATLGDYAHVPIHGRMAGLDIMTLAHVNLSQGLVLKPRSILWKVLFCLLGAVLPLFIAYRHAANEWKTLVIFGLAISTVGTLNLALPGYFGRQSELLFPLMLSAFTLLGLMFRRIKLLYDERRSFYLEKLAADEANALKSQFLSHMTHELRTPLTAIMGYNRLLADPELSETERASQVGIIDKNCQHLLALINNLLDQAKLEAGQMTLDIVGVNAKGLMKSVVDTLHPIADQKGLSVEFRLSSKVPSGIRVDELRVRQILVNLGGNGIKFAEKGGVNFDVDWSDGWLVIKVIDTGPGMGAQTLAHIFEAFQQADIKVAKTHGGTGLGLTISRNLARLMGGDIDVVSVVGKGSTFTVQIPAEGFEFPMVAKKRDQAPIISQLSGRVLVADDTEDLRHLLSLYLKKLGVEVLLAENGQRAVDIAMKEKPDLVFMDMQMPVMDGVQAVQTLREHKYGGTVLALTAQSDRDRIEAMLAAGCDGYVEKPLSRERLYEIVKTHLKTQRADGGSEAEPLENVSPEPGRV